MKKSVLFRQLKHKCHRWMKTMAKYTNQPSTITVFARFGTQYLFADLNKMLARKTFELDKEVGAEIETFFAVKHKSFHKKVMEMLKKHQNNCSALKVEYCMLMNNVEFCQKIVVSLVILWTFQTMCYISFIPITVFEVEYESYCFLIVN